MTNQEAGTSRPISPEVPLRENSMKPPEALVEPTVTGSALGPDDHIDCTLATRSEPPQDGAPKSMPESPIVMTSSPSAMRPSLTSRSSRPENDT